MDPRYYNGDVDPREFSEHVCEACGAVLYPEEVGRMLCRRCFEDVLADLEDEDHAA